MKNILKYPGSKWRIADWIISHFPAGYEKMTYLEPYFGSGAVFFTKKRSKIETVNDLDDDVVNLFRVARDYPEDLAKAVYLTPWSRTEYRLSYNREGADPVEQARCFVVRMWQGIGAKSSTSTGWRKNIKSTNGNVTRFAISLPDAILDIVDRFKHDNGNRLVQIECRPAMELIQSHNRSDCLIYVDPPYVMDTRSGKIYKHEMTDDDHRALLDILRDHKGKVVLSGYDNPIYSEVLSDWYKAEKQARTESTAIKTEVIWCNYTPEVQSRLYGDEGKGA